MPAAVLRARSRFEMPVLLGWLVGCCVTQNALIWIALGVGMMVFSVLMRDTFEVCRLDGQAAVYRALGAGQIAFTLAAWAKADALGPWLALYCLGLLVGWIFVEFRHLYHVERQDDAGSPYYL